MKNTFKLLTIVFLFAFIHSCKKDKPTIPIVTTSTVKEISYTSATSGGNVTDDGGSITTRGVCWGTTSSPTISDSKTEDGTGVGEFTSTLTGLSGNTTYYVRAYATNSAGTSYGDELSFDTYAAMDADGNLYNSVTIGMQIWLNENLKTTKYNDNTSIPYVPDNTTWNNSLSPGYCWYNNDEASSKDTYGALYNWYAVNTEKLCPLGWHVPSHTEWKTLEVYLGMTQQQADFSGGFRGTDEGGKLKETGTTHWLSPNTGATNETGFNAVPGGYRKYSGSYLWVGELGYWWSATEHAYLDAYYRGLFYNYSSIYAGYTNVKVSGQSVRCLKDN